MARNRYFEDEELTYRFNGSSLKKSWQFIKPHRKVLYSRRSCWA